MKNVDNKPGSKAIIPLQLNILKMELILGNLKVAV
jgi:hypothetical protein